MTSNKQDEIIRHDEIMQHDDSIRHAEIMKRDQIMTIDELAAYLRISKSTLYKLAVENKLPGQKIGKRWRFHKEAIDQWGKQGPSHPRRHPTP